LTGGRLAPTLLVNLERALVFRILDELRADTRHAFRQLLGSPVFGAVAVLSLALSIGANTAIFSVIDAVLLKTLPVRDPQSLFFVDNSGGKSGGNNGPPYPCYELLRDHNRTLAGIAAFDEARFKVTIDGSTEELRGLYASGSFFDLLGVGAARGRVFTPVDDSIPGQGGPDGGVAIISHGLWRRRFAMDPAVLGKTMLVGTKTVTIVGVTSADFLGLQVGSPVDIAIPMTLSDNNLRSRSLWWFSVIARLKPGIAVEQARVELHTLWDGYMTDIGQPREKRTYFSGIELVPASRGLNGLRRELSRPLLIVMGIVGLVLLIGCANVANLLLARASARRRELALRLALGAGRGRLIRQLLTEGAVLAGCGGLLGLLFARGGVSVLLLLLAGPDGFTGPNLDPRFDARVLGFTLAVATLTGLLFALAPALQATRFDGARPLTPAVTSTPWARGRLGQSLIVVQVVLSMVLLSASLLFLRTLQNLHAVDPGFEDEGVLSLEVQATIPRPATAKPTLDEIRSQHARLGAMWNTLAEALAQLPGVSTAAAATMVPLSGRDRGVVIAVTGGAPGPERDGGIHVNHITSGYFEAMGIELMSGRGFTTGDRAASSRAAILNQTAARAYFGEEDPLGRLVTFPGQRVPDAFEIVGVVRDSQYVNLRTPDERMVYLPIEQALDPIASAMTIVRAGGDVTRLVTPVRAVAQQSVPGGFVTRIATLEERVSISLVRERLLSLLSTFFSSLALLLACIGLYGTMAYAVVRQTREIGIRTALGARKAAVIWAVVRETMMVVVAGVLTGVAAAIVMGRFVEGLLFDIEPGDPITLALAVAVLMASAAAAGYLPARRAARVDPVIALRCE
jgi:predicted permease